MATQLEETLARSSRTRIDADPKATKRLQTKEAASNQEQGTTSGKPHKKPAYLQSLNEAEKAENFKIIDSMNKKISFLKNPRYKVNKIPIPTNTVSFYDESQNTEKQPTTQTLSE